MSVSPFRSVYRTDARERTFRNERFALEPTTERFIDSLVGSTPFYQMTPQQARQALIDIQRQYPVSSPSVDQELIEIPFGPHHDEIVQALLYRPNQEGNPLLPIVIYIHGGGWILGNFETHRHLLCELTAQSGCAFLFVSYTPSPEAQYPRALNEIMAATDFILAHGHDYHLDPSRLAFAGDSVGGNMAIAVTLTQRYDLRYLALFYPVTDVANLDTPSYRQFQNGPWLTLPAVEWFYNAYEPDFEKRTDIFISPSYATQNMLSRFPPTLIITDENDVLRDEGNEFGRRLAAAGVDATRVQFNGTCHDFMMLNPLADTPAAKGAITQGAIHLRQALFQ